MDTREESLRLLKEAKEDLGRAMRYSGLKDSITTIHYTQLAIEKSAKALISCFEAFEWTHDPSEQLKKLLRRELLITDFLKIASYVKEAAPWHLVYDIESLKKVPSWQTLNLIRDACFVYAPEWIKEAFKMILEKAEQCGIVYDRKEKVFKSKRPGRIVFSD